MFHLHVINHLKFVKNQDSIMVLFIA